MPSLSQRPRRRPAHDEDEEEPPSRRRRQLAEEEVEEEEEEDDGEDENEAEEQGDYEEEDEEDAEEDEPARRRANKQKEKRRRQRAAERRGNAADSGGDDDDDDDNDDDDDDGAPQTQVDRQKLYHELLAKKLVRYALACEPRRQPIRRQAVKEQVLENEGKHFRKVFPVAQDQLRAVFGMEMVEWPARDKTTMSVRERRKALKSQKSTTAAAKAAAVAAAAAARIDRYMLVSTLPEAYRASVFTMIPSDPSLNSSVGKPLPPAPDAAYVGFCTLVVALITLSGGEMSHADLEKYLSVLHNGRQAPARADEDFLQPMTATMGDHIDDDDGGGGAGGGGGQQDGGDSTPSQGGTLQYLVRQGYVVRVVEAPTTAEGRGPVGGRGPGAGSNGVPTGSKVKWHVGPRGQQEIGPAEVAAVVRHIYGDDAGEDLEQRLESSLRAAKGAASEKRQRGGRQEEAVVEL